MRGRRRNILIATSVLSVSLAIGVFYVWFDVDVSPDIDLLPELDAKPNGIGDLELAYRLMCDAPHRSDEETLRLVGGLVDRVLDECEALGKGDCGQDLSFLEELLLLQSERLEQARSPDKILNLLLGGLRLSRETRKIATTYRVYDDGVVYEELFLSQLSIAMSANSASGERFRESSASFVKELSHKGEVPLLIRCSYSRFRDYCIGEGRRFGFMPNATREAAAGELREVLRLWGVPKLGRLSARPRVDPRFSMQMSGNWSGASFLSGILGGWARVEFYETRLLGMRRVALVRILVEQYLRERGSLPEELGDLVPSIIAEVPKDPYDGEEIRYSSKGGEVWSLADPEGAPGYDPTPLLTSPPLDSSSLGD